MNIWNILAHHHHHHHHVPSTRSGLEAAFLQACLRLVLLDGKWYPIPVHFSIFAVHFNLGLPGPLLPVVFPFRILLCNVLCLVMWPNYLSFLVFIDSDSRWLSFSFIRLSTSSLVTLRNEDEGKDDGSCENYYFSFSLIPFLMINKFSFSTLHEILEKKKVKGSASKANKVCQILLFDVHVFHRTPKVSFPRRFSSLHSIVQFLFSLRLLFFAVPVAIIVS